MASGSLYLAVPAMAAAAAAAAGFLFLGTSHSGATQGLGGCMEEWVVRMKDKVKGGQVAKMVAVAPQFDGLHCFETLVMTGGR